jgi:hypothetical protein
MRKYIKIFGMVAVIVFAASFIPFETTFVPEWKLRVVNEKGVPLSGQFVAQYCTNYTLGIHPCEGVNDDSKITDKNGYVVFPARKIRASLLYRIVRPALGLVLLIANGEYGTNGSVATSGPWGTKSIDYTPGKPLPSEIVLPSKETSVEK